MLNGKTFLGVIAARAGSKGLPGKNMMLFKGQPMVRHTIIAMQDSEVMDRIVCTSDDIDLLNYCAERGVSYCIVRPPHYATDMADIRDVMVHCCRSVDGIFGPYDYVVLVSPTNPNRDADDISKACNIAANNDADAVISVRQLGLPKRFVVDAASDGRLTTRLTEDDICRRQECPPSYLLNGGVVVAKWELWAQRRLIYDAQRVFVSPLPRFHDTEIDTIEDVTQAYLDAEAIRGPRND